MEKLEERPAEEKLEERLAEERGLNRHGYRLHNNTVDGVSRLAMNSCADIVKSAIGKKEVYSEVRNG